MIKRQTPRAVSASRDTLLGKLPSWDDVRFFLVIHRSGSLTAAAVTLGVTQPTCGRRLAALEASLGLRLFDRTPDGLRITADGKTLLDAATRMEDSANDLALRATVRDRELEGVVRIATSELFACSFLTGALQQARERYPGVRVELVLSNTETDLLRREADVAIRFGPLGSRPKPPALVAQRLGDEPFLLYGQDTYLRRREGPPIRTTSPSTTSWSTRAATRRPNGVPGRSPARRWSCQRRACRSPEPPSPPAWAWVSSRGAQHDSSPRYVRSLRWSPTERDG